eukprot:380718_1
MECKENDEIKSENESCLFLLDKMRKEELGAFESKVRKERVDTLHQLQVGWIANVLRDQLEAIYTSLALKETNEKGRTVVQQLVSEMDGIDVVFGKPPLEKCTNMMNTTEVCTKKMTEDDKINEFEDDEEEEQ